MVKGVSKRIVHIKTPPGNTFSEAIFILKEEAVGLSEDEIIKEAISVAEKSGGKAGKISRKTATNILFSIFGALIMATLWALSAII